MKVLFITRNNIYSSPGGDTVQLLETAKYLEKYGVQFDIVEAGLFEEAKAPLYDLVHIFNIIVPDQLLAITEGLPIPYVVSTIYIDYSEFERKARGGFLQLIAKLIHKDYIDYLKILVKAIVKRQYKISRRFILKGYYKSIKEIAEKSQMLLPNSDSEYFRFNERFGTNTPYKVIPNGINLKVFNTEICPNKKYNNFIVCVGRIEALKNQLNVIRALNDSPYQVVFIGKCAPYQNRYYNLCKKEAGKNIIFIDQIEQDKLAAILKAAKVHVLASWFETTGLVSLEAAVMGCNIVISKKGDQQEYFKSDAFYCDPDNIVSIRNAVDKAYSSCFLGILKERIVSNYTWQRAAEKTFEAYKEVLRID